MKMRKQIRQQMLQIVVPPSTRPTTVLLTVELYDGDKYIEPLLSDGLVPPNLFRWGDRSAELGPLEFKVLEAVMTAENHRLPLQHVRKLWPKEPEDKQIRVIISRINKQLLKVDFDNSLHLRKGYVVIE